MISISGSHWLAGVREATGCTADQARVYLAVATMPLSSQANVAGVLQWRPRRVQTALKALMDGGLLRFYNLGCEAHLSRRYYINYGRILTLGERFLDLWAPLLHWHVPACLAYLLQRLPLLEHIYAAVADQHGIGPLEEFRWFRGTPWRAAARFRDGWVPYHWIGTPSGRGDIADTLNRTAAEIQDQRWEGEAPIPHHMVIITPDLWQEWQVTEVAGEMGILQHLQLRSVRGGIVYGPREGWPSRGWVVDPLPPPRPGPWTLDDQLAASRWRQPGGWLATRLVDCVLEWPGATSRFATAYVYGCRDEEAEPSRKWCGVSSMPCVPDSTCGVSRLTDAPVCISSTPPATTSPPPGMASTTGAYPTDTPPSRAGGRDPGRKHSPAPSSLTSWEQGSWRSSSMKRASS